MDVSVITPVYNEPRLEETLDSILDQEGISNLEIVVVDGGSTDDTSAVIDKYRDAIDLLIRGPDQGVYDAMNKGIRAATGDVLGVLNADDRYQDEFVIRDILKRMEETGARTCYGDLVYVDKNDNIRRYWKSGSFRARRFYFGWMPPHPTFFVHSAVYEEFGLFDLNFEIAADYELMLRFLLNYDVSVAYLDRVLVRMATGGQSNESICNVFRANVEVTRSWKKNDLVGGSIVGLVKPMRKILQFFREPTASSK
jgi:glycosyltransferase